MTCHKRVCVLSRSNDEERSFDWRLHRERSMWRSRRGKRTEDDAIGETPNFVTLRAFRFVGGGALGAVMFRADLGVYRGAA